MKLKAIVAIAILALTGCAGAARKNENQAVDRNPSSENTHKCVAKVGPSCRAKIRWICAEGFEDACVQNPEGIHTCVPKAKSSCNTRIMHHCPDHFVNGCDTGETTVHTCVPAAEGSSCAQEIAMDCPAGFVDRCLIDSEWDGPRNND